MRVDSFSGLGQSNNLHYHDGSTCHGKPTLKQCIEQAKQKGWFGKILEITDTQDRTKKKVKCYSLICDAFVHYGKYGKFVATISPKTVVTILKKSTRK